MRVFRTAAAGLMTDTCGILHTNGYKDTNPNDNLYEVKKIILKGIIVHGLYEDIK